MFQHIDWCQSTGAYGDMDCSCPETEREEFLLVNSINIGTLTEQAMWSDQTFGPGLRTKGIISHAFSELLEIENSPTDLYEWIDLAHLALDGARRAGYTPQEIIKAYKDKLQTNMTRDWPDWRTADPDKAIEHVRS